MASATGKNRGAQKQAKEEDTSSEVDTITYMQVETDEAKAGGGSAYGVWQKAQELADEKRAEFEKSYIANAKKAGAIPEGYTLRFYYKYGIAVRFAKDNGTGKASTAKASFSIGGGGGSTSKLIKKEG
jgi:hypothetical protein